MDSTNVDEAFNRVITGKLFFLT